MRIWAAVLRAAKVRFSHLICTEIDSLLDALKYSCLDDEILLSFVWHYFVGCVAMYCIVAFSTATHITRVEGRKSWNNILWVGWRGWGLSRGLKCLSCFHEKCWSSMPEMLSFVPISSSNDSLVLKIVTETFLMSTELTHRVLPLQSYIMNLRKSYYVWR